MDAFCLLRCLAQGMRNVVYCCLVFTGLCLMSLQSSWIHCLEQTPPGGH